MSSFSLIVALSALVLSVLRDYFVHNKKAVSRLYYTVRSPLLKYADIDFQIMRCVINPCCCSK